MTISWKIPPDLQLVRAIGRWTLVALVLNNVIGSGIFGLPSAIASYLGSAAPLAYVCGAVAIGHAASDPCDG